MARTCCFVPVSTFIEDELKATGVESEQIEVIYGRPLNRSDKEVNSAIPPRRIPRRNTALDCWLNFQVARGRLDKKFAR